MIPQFLVLVVLLGAVNHGMAACRDKLPMDNFSPDLVPGKYYLIATKPAFSEQGGELRCGTSYLNSSVPLHFNYIITEETSDGSILTVNLNITNESPPGVWKVTSVNGALTFHGSVLGAIKDTIHVYYACNAQSGKEGVWIYYYKRVNGVSEIDRASLQYALQVLYENNISLVGFQEVNNRNCSN